MQIDTENWSVTWPQDKRLATREALRNLLRSKIVTPRDLARVLGRLKASALAWPTVHLETFGIQRVLSSAATRGWDTPLDLNQQTRFALR